MNEISLKCFLHSFKESCYNEGRYCFILGAGASKESGIKTGIEMANIWYDEIHSRYSQYEINQLISTLGLEEASFENKNYFDIYDLRFYPNYQNGYSYIERIMESAQPSYGYYPLAMQLANTNNNLVITTNFDSMVEDALFIYTDKRPVVVGHELLASYININSKRPIIAKIHRGLFFEPFSRRTELVGLSEKWKQVLRTAFQVFTPIVIGYAGGDNSLMDFLKDDSVEMKGFYWCYYKGEVLSDEIRGLIELKNGCAIPIDGFDSMMFSLSEIYPTDSPSERIRTAANKRIDLYEKKYTEFSKKLKAIENPDESQSQLITMLNNANERSIETAQNRIKKNPKDRSAYIDLGIQYRLNKEYQKALDCFTSAIELNPDEEMVYVQRGTTYREMGENTQAILDFSQAIKINPVNDALYSDRGNIYYSSGDFENALPGQ